MTSNFSLKTRKHHQDVHIKLHGIFDGNSAFQLIHALQKARDHDRPVFIDTNNLTRAYPFGRTILDRHLPQNAFRTKLHFFGVRAKEIVPEGCTLLKSNKHITHKCRGNCKNCTCRHEKSGFNVRGKRQL